MDGAVLERERERAGVGRSRSAHPPTRLAPMQMTTYTEFVNQVNKVVGDARKSTDANENNRGVLGLRFELGATDDARYLNAGVAVLWSCINETGKDGHELAPESLYTVDAAAAVTRRAAMRALEGATRDADAEEVELLQFVWLVLLELQGSIGGEFENAVEKAKESHAQNRAKADGESATNVDSEVPSVEIILNLCETLLECLNKSGDDFECDDVFEEADELEAPATEPETPPEPEPEADGDGAPAPAKPAPDGGAEESAAGAEPASQSPQGFVSRLFRRGGSTPSTRCLERGLVGVRGPHQPLPALGGTSAEGDLAYARPNLNDGQLRERLRLLKRVCAQRGIRATRTARPTSSTLRSGFSIANAAAEIAMEEHGHCTHRGLATCKVTKFDGARATHGILEEVRKVEWVPRPRCAVSKLVAAAAALEHEHLAKQAVASALEAKVTTNAKSGTASATSASAVLRAQSLVAKTRQLPLLEWLDALSSTESELVQKVLAPQVPMVTRPCYIDRNGKLHTSGMPVAVDNVDAFLKSDKAVALNNLLPKARRSANPATGSFEFSDADFASLGATLGRGPDAATAVATGALSAEERVLWEGLQESARQWFQSSDSGAVLTPDDIRNVLTLGVDVGTRILHARKTAALVAVKKAKEAADAAENNPAIQRRAGLWTEFMRSLAIGHDPLWVFVKTLSGFLGEDINSVITMADDAAIRASRAIQQQKLAIAKRVSETQARIVETIVTALAKDSRLAFDKNSAGALVVVDNETRAQLKELASGTSGRPFFEASQALTALRAGDPSKQTTLEALLNDVTNAGHAIQRQLIENMAGLTDASTSGFGAGMASLAELSQPHNSFFVNMKPDVVAALKSAHDKLGVEMAFQGVREIKLWELVEGGCDDLSMRFAETTALVLAQLRASGGVNAMYVPKHAIETNALQARMSMTKLSNLAAAYATRVSAPSPPTGGGDGIAARNAQVASAQKVRARDALAVAGIDPMAARRHGRGAKRPLPYATPEAGGRWLGYH